ncbi:ferritin-like domain-containing protein [Halopelagius fulvigenes]|uniref:Ferritin-like domain-containing protein n=1 Tax=Halopelagius fulvigenes TaxID=1198324 RepID=A0ABD5TS28_9EURY
MEYDQNEDRERADGAETNDSRRRFLAGSAGALGAVALGGAFGTGSALATDNESDESAPQEPMDDVFEDDIAVLNYALTLEYLEAAFYRRALEKMDQNELLCNYLDVLPESVRERIYDELTVIRDHEETHVEYLTEVINDLGGEPVEEPEFDFGSTVEDPVEFIQTAAVLEDTGVGAYAGAAPSIENQDLVPPALSILSVEARHASFVRELAGEIGFPEAFDDPLPKDVVLERASQFIVEE